MIVQYIHQCNLLSRLLDSSYYFINVVVLHAVIHGAGGMHMVDPLFQRVLVTECRNRIIPVIFDEVFTGFWRLGVEVLNVNSIWSHLVIIVHSHFANKLPFFFSTKTTAELVGCKPDIACYAKLMTGGMVPLAVTLATDAVFDSFSGDSKVRKRKFRKSHSLSKPSSCIFYSTWSRLIFFVGFSLKPCFMVTHTQLMLWDAQQQPKPSNGSKIQRLTITSLHKEGP